MRAKAFFVMAVALFWSASVFSETTDFDVGSFVDGNELFRVCSNSHDVAQAYCTGYVVGVTDAFMAVNGLIANGRTMPSTCPPKEHLAPDQVRDVVVQYLTTHPEERHLAAAADALRALLAAFPCK
jgi:hypothetical protein